MTTTYTDRHTLSELISSLGSQFSHLARKEIQLAKLELRQSLREAVRDSVLLLAGAGLALLAVLTLCGALAAGLTVLFDLFMPLGVAVWLGPLVLALLLGGAAAAVIQIGRRRLQQADFKPRHTQQSLQEDAQWLKNRFH